MSAAPTLTVVPGGPSPLISIPPHVEGEPPPSCWVLLWSQSQCALHVEPLERMLAMNRSAYSDDRRMDYVPLVIAGEEFVRKAATAVRQTIELRSRARTALQSPN